jgi:hypothetical protein
MGKFPTAYGHAGFVFLAGSKMPFAGQGDAGHDDAAKIRRGAQGLEVKRDGLGWVAGAEKGVGLGEGSHKEYFSPCWFSFSLYWDRAIKTKPGEH